jgi:hypothetical protein
MKRLLLLTLALLLSLAPMVRADNGETNQRKNKHQAEAVVPNRSQKAAPKVKQAAKQVPPKTAPTQRLVSNAPRSVAPTRHTATRAPRPVKAAVQSQPVKSEAQLDGRNRQGTQPSNQAKKGKRHVDRNSYYVARGRGVRGYHNRNWWRSRYNTTFILCGGGYYFWNLGYWYPAYGYSPYYNNYLYSEPIYGYNNLAPGQVVENVQLALRDQGYYPGAIDGLIGPQTRAALAAFQRDHGLIVTSAVDEPTLVTLGLA